MQSVAMNKITISSLCNIEGITRQAFYKEKQVRQCKQNDEATILDLVMQLRIKHPRMGGRKLFFELQSGFKEHNLVIGRDQFFTILRNNQLLVSRKKKFMKTTYRDTSLPVFRNLLYDLKASFPNEVWVSDITYIDTQEGYMYLSLVTDLYSRKIVGYELSESLESKETLKALLKAIEELPSHCYPIHHSDRGSQYCSHEYVKVLTDRGLPVSMTEKNHCYENCYAERVNGILKDEYNLDMQFKTKAQAAIAVAQAICMYNNYRPHTSLNYRKPSQVHQLAA